MDSAEVTLSALIQMYSDIEMVTTIRRGDLMKESLDELKRGEYGLIIISAPHGRWLGDYSMSCTTRAFVNHSMVSVRFQACI